MARLRAKGGEPQPATPTNQDFGGTLFGICVVGQTLFGCCRLGLLGRIFNETAQRNCHRVCILNKACSIKPLPLICRVCPSGPLGLDLWRENTTRLMLEILNFPFINVFDEAALSEKRLPVHWSTCAGECGGAGRQGGGGRGSRHNIRHRNPAVE